MKYDTENEIFAVARCKNFSFKSVTGFGILLVVSLMNNRSLSLMNKWFDPLNN